MAVRTVAFAFVSPVFMAVGAGEGAGNGSGVNGGSGVGGGKGSVPRSRLAEFAFSGGDHGVQAELVRQVIMRSAEVGLTDVIDGKIAEFEGGVKTRMDGMFDRRERDIIERNEALALRASLADLARWNSSWRESQTTSAKRRQEISAELAIVNKLLLSAERKKSSRRRSGRRRRTRQAVVVGGGDAALRRADGGPSLAAVTAISALCGLCLKGAGSYVEQHGPEDLARVSFASLGLVAMGIYCHALYRLAEEERRRGR